jgi:hypothetical protein
VILGIVMLGVVLAGPDATAVGLSVGRGAMEGVGVAETRGLALGLGLGLGLGVGLASPPDPTGEGTELATATTWALWSD